MLALLITLLVAPSLTFDSIDPFSLSGFVMIAEQTIAGVMLGFVLTAVIANFCYCWAVSCYADGIGFCVDGGSS